ncbi:MAG: putative 4-mercaptohistidine N1-methyltransferase [Terrimicrobiaceae bacterium]|nr:putative 4-mercaptohistidine N1-methyltransferase [Terrimicrobiaceae bacterium]
MSGNIYESPKLVSEYLLLHYGNVEEVLGGKPGPAEAVDFPARLVRELLAPVEPGSRALDLGCAVGRSSFELARSCSEVIGIDYSHAFITAASRLRDTGGHAYEKAVEGELTAPGFARVPAEIDCSRVRFEQGDAMDFHDPEAFSVVLAANLLCRLPDPKRLIDRLPSLVRRGGQLLLTTPFTWLEDFTPRAHWIGGTPATGRSFDALRALLDPHFGLEHVADLPFLIREHSRKFQYGIACGSRWRRR